MKHKMMKTSKIISLAAGLLLLSACNSDLGENALDDRIPINLGYEVLTVDDATRTAASTTLNDSYICSDDAVMVKIKNNGADASTYTSYTYTAGASGAMTPPSPKPYYPTGSTNIDILAYYPSTAGNNSNFDVNADQTSDDNYKASDLMVATVTNQAKTTSTVALAFQHKMAKLVVTATKGDGVNTIQTITLKNVKRRVSFTNTSGAVGTTATEISGSTDVILFKEGSAASGTGAALIPDQTITGDVLEIVTDQGTATYSVPDGKAFAANTKYTISVKVNRAAVGITNSITWGSSASLEVQPTVEVEVTKNQYPWGLPGKFTINSGGTKVCFSQGNLQYIGSASPPYWKFADNQYDYLGTTTGQNSDATNVDRDLFGWGTSGWNNGNAFYQPYSTSNTTSGTYTSSNGYGYGPTDGSTYTYSLTGTYAKSDWGVCNAILNGGNTAGMWRTLTSAEWTYVFNTRTTGGTVFGTTQARYTMATIRTDVGSGVNGIILFPDGVDIASSEVTTAGTVNGTSAWTTKCTAAQWSALESKGCVFLPAAGRRLGTSVNNAGSLGNYWSSTANGTDYACRVYFYSGSLSPASGDNRYLGRSVRLVRQVE